jgi:transcription elongation factor Elf1
MSAATVGKGGKKRLPKPKQLPKPGGCPKCGSRTITFDTEKQMMRCKFCDELWKED